MGYRFLEGEAPGTGLQRVVLEVLGDASAVLRVPPDGDVDVAVHEARKSVKKARAALQLGRELLPKKDRKRLDASVRALAKALAPSRDATVSVATARALARQAGLEAPSAGLEGFLRDALGRGAIDDESAAQLDGPSSPARSLTSVAEAFDAARDEAASAGWRAGGTSALREGLLRLHAAGAKAWRRVEDPPDAERLHVCRGHVKRIGYALRLLEPSWPVFVHAEASEVERLDKALGLDHDRSLLRATLLDPSLPEPLRAEATALVAATDATTERERHSVLPTAARLFAERPEAFARRHAAWWKRWRDEERRATKRG